MKNQTRIERLKETIKIINKKILKFSYKAWIATFKYVFRPIGQVIKTVVFTYVGAVIAFVPLFGLAIYKSLFEKKVDSNKRIGYNVVYMTKEEYLKEQSRKLSARGQ